MEKILDKKTEKKVHTLGSRFSQDVHGIFADTKKAVRTIIQESELEHAWSVPLIVIIAAAIMSVIGEALVFDVSLTVSGLPFWLKLFVSFAKGLELTLKIIFAPFVLAVIWLLYSIVFHFIGSIVSSADITKGNTFYRTVKLTGFIFAPQFLNVLPILPFKELYVMPIITGFWGTYIAYQAMKANYETSGKGAFIIILPHLFSVFYLQLVPFLQNLAAV